MNVSSSTGTTTGVEIDDFLPRQGRTFLVVGASNSGKTSLVFDILDQWQRDDPTVNDRIIVYYDVYQDRYNGLDARPGLETLECDPEEMRDKILVLDDLQYRLKDRAECLERIYTTMSHHYNITVFIILQNIIDFKMAGVTKNASYIIVLRSRQSIQFLRHLQLTLFPYAQKALVRAQQQNPYRFQRDKTTSITDTY